MLLAVAAACAGETVEVPGETVVVEKVVTETVEVPGETVVVEKEVIKTVEVPGETVTKEVVKEVMVPGETVVVEKEVVKTVEVPGQTVVKEVVKTVEVPGQTVVVEKEVVKTVEVPGETVVVTKEVAVPVEVVREVPSGKNYVTDPTTGKVVSAPEYGGTFTYAAKSGTAPNFDTLFHPWASLPVGGVVEQLGIVNWAIDRNEYDFTPSYVPLSVFVGWLAESWDTPDPLTIIFNIRKGVNWHNKVPMNGRELTASDVEYNLHRIFGLGSGWTAENKPPVLYGASVTNLPVESITATDEWTVVLKMKEPPPPGAVVQLIHNAVVYINPPEVIEQYGDMQDWRNVVGTGPYELTDYVEDVSITHTKYPNYWGYDEKFPENRLPYIDEARGLYMKERATQLAALRTAKVDYIGRIGLTTFNNIDQAESLRKTNPEIELWPFVYRSGTGYAMETTKPPFGDIRVRKAMQMALDHETINNTFFKGYGSWKPEGLVGDAVSGVATPFEEWPEELQQEYTYNPAAAEALLDAAGYPRGADGIRFKTDVVHSVLHLDVGYTELAVGYWAEIGI